MFYPDNVPRAERLQQLITHIGVIQSDISNEQKRMEDLDSVCRTKLEELLKAGKVQSLDKLKEEAMSKLPDDEKRVFNGLIDGVTGQTRSVLWVGLLGCGTKISELGMSFLQGLGRVQDVCENMIDPVDISKGTKMSTVVTTGVMGCLEQWPTISAYIQHIQQLLKQAYDIFLETQLGGVLVELTADLRSLWQSIQKHLCYLKMYACTRKVAVRCGVFAVGIVVCSVIYSVLTGHNQKAALVEGIHKLQVARLMIDRLKQEAVNIIGQMVLMDTYLDMLSTEDEITVAKIGDRIIKNITEQDNKIDFSKLEDDLHRVDKSALKFYGKDDLGRDDVVRQAQLERDETIQQDLGEK